MYLAHFLRHGLDHLDPPAEHGLEALPALPNVVEADMEKICFFFLRPEQKRLVNYCFICDISISLVYSDSIDVRMS